MILSQQKTEEEAQLIKDEDFYKFWPKEMGSKFIQRFKIHNMAIQSSLHFMSEILHTLLHSAQSGVQLMLFTSHTKSDFHF